MILQNIQQVNQDMMINNHYLQNYIQSTTSFNTNKFFNSQRLLDALRKRNEQHRKTKDTRKMDPIPQPIRQLYDRFIKQQKISNFKVQKESQKLHLARQLSSQLYWLHFTIANQQQFVDRHQQFLIHKIIANSIKANSNVEKRVKTLMMNNLKGLKDDLEYSPSRIRSTIKIQDQLETNSTKYNDYVKRKIFSSEKMTAYLEEFEHLEGDIAYLWKIVNKQFKSYDIAKQQEKGNPLCALTNTSIKLAQAKFREQLPSLSNEKQVSEYMRKKYVASSQNYNCQTNAEGLLTWAIPFAYYRAGAWSNFAVNLSYQGKNGFELTEQFRKFQQSLQALNPTPQYFQEASINDMFYKQLIAIVKGTSLYQQRLAKIGSLDLVWLALKTLKIYSYIDEYRQLQLDDVISAILNHFLMHKDMYSSRSTCMIPYAQFLYLSAYKTLIQYRKSAAKLGLTNDDFLHLLLVLQSKPQVLDQQTYQCILETLQHQLISYLSYLIRMPQRKDYTIFYILSIPVRIFKNVVVAVFNNWEIFNQINNFAVDGERGWKYVKFSFQFFQDSSIFQDTMINLFRNFINSAQNSYDTQLQIINQAESLLSQPIDYVNFVLQCQCNHLLKLKNQEELQNKLLFTSQGKKQETRTSIYNILNNKLKDFTQNNPQLQQQFNPFIEFLHKLCKLEDLKRQKQINNLQNFIKNQQYVRDLPMLLSNSSNYMKLLFDKLNQCNALKLFFIYVKLVVQSWEKISYLRAIHDKVRNYKDSLQKTLIKIQKQTNYKIDQLVQYLQK